MKLDRIKLAPMGLLLALVALLVSGGLYIVYRQWNLPLQISLAVVVIGVALWVILDPSKARSVLTGRQARYGSNALIMSLAVIGIVIVANYLTYKNPKRWDLTEDKTYTLSPETIKLVKSLPQPVHVRGYFTPDMSVDQTRSLLDQYRYNAPDKFSYDFTNPLENPTEARAQNITQNGTLVLTMGDRKELVTSATEDNLDGALVRMMGQKKTIYFLTGHGEYSPEQTGDNGASQAKTSLESKNYTVKTLNLLSDKKIPDDANLIVIAGPTKPVSQDETLVISEFVAKGGALVVLADSPVISNLKLADDPVGQYLKTTWGIVLGDDMVLDATSQYQQIAVENKYGSHPITSGLQTLVSIFPTARSVSVVSVPNVTDTPLVMTAAYPQSYAETDLEALKNNQVSPDQGKDVFGPVTLAAAGEMTGSKGRVVVFGDADFIVDAYFNQTGNGQLLVNAVDWSLTQENLINLTPKTPKPRTMVPPTQVVYGLIILVSIFVIPGSVLAGGIFSWIARRRRG